MFALASAGTRGSDARCMRLKRLLSPTELPLLEWAIDTSVCVDTFCSLIYLEHGCEPSDVASGKLLELAIPTLG